MDEDEQMKTSVKELRSLIREALQERPGRGPNTDRVFVIIPFVARGEVTNVDGMQFVEVGGPPETPGNRQAYVAWKETNVPIEDEDEQTKIADRVNFHFSSYVEFDDDRGQLKSWHVLIWLEGPDAVTVNTSGESDEAYMFDDMNCDMGTLRELGVLQ